ncbi:hypothetical protein CYMTET_13206 [Cymbomonas tetramitiformis]|uniref:Nucleotide-diphospho-sugar transferase domain-containing protein n=1 Tax=Cymbomonas tetramitiformis TaxID=36881 RepID=A0AAE0GJ04_9CHLO|nr:hypothetical protein CYMTET_13206 [Cymbomonas tetramitiformis]
MLQKLKLLCAAVAVLVTAPPRQLATAAKPRKFVSGAHSDRGAVPPTSSVSAPPPALQKSQPLNSLSPVLGHHCYPSTHRANCPSTESTLYGSTDLNSTFLAAANCTCTKDKTIIISMVNKGMLDVFDVQYKTTSFFVPHVLGMWVVVAMDTTSLKHCQQHWKHCVLDPQFSTDQTMESEHTYSDKNESSKYMYTRICWRRVEVVNMALRLGLNVIFTDLDVAWLKDPRPYLRHDVDLQMGPIQSNHDFNRTDPKSYTRFPGALNAGFYHIRASNASLHYMLGWIEDGRHKLHDENLIKHHEGMSAGNAIQYGAAETLRYWWLDNKYTPTDSVIYSKLSGPCLSAIFHAAPGSGHEGKVKAMTNQFEMKMKCTSFHDANDTGLLFKEGYPVPPISPQITSASPSTSTNVLKKAYHGLLNSSTVVTALCWPSSTACPSSNTTRYGNAGMQQVFMKAAEAQQGSVIISLLHSIEMELFEVWCDVMLSYLPDVLHSWVVITTSNNTQELCETKLKLCAMDPAPVAYPNSTAAGARGIIEELLHWRLVELMAIALRNNLTVTASNFHTVWMQDARLFLNPEAHFQMAVRSTPRVLVCKKDGIYDGPNEANGEDCSLGPTAEGIYHMKPCDASQTFIGEWLKDGFEQIHNDNGFLPWRASGKFLRQNDQHIQKGLIYAHMDYRHLPGDTALSRDVKDKDLCGLAIEVYDADSSMKSIVEQMRHAANYFRKCHADGPKPEIQRTKRPHRFAPKHDLS